MPRLLPYLSPFVLPLLLVTAVPSQAQSNLLASPTHLALTQAEEKTLQTKAINLIESARLGKYSTVREQLSPTLAQGVSEAAIKTRWEQVTALTGPMEKILSSRVISIVDGNLVIVTVKFAEVTDEIIVTFNNTGEVVGVNLPDNASIEAIAAKVTEAIDTQNLTLIRAHLHPFLKTEIYPQQMQARWARLEQKYGQFKRVKDTDIKANLEADKTNIVIVNVEFARGTQEIFFIFDDQAQITGIDFVQ